ncbi:thiolase family protein [bacterium]|nr:thiolase family protein [bacterium]
MKPDRLAILAGVRTPFVKSGDVFKDLPAYELARLVMREVIDRTGLEPGAVDEVILGNVAQPAEAANIARVSALLAGLPIETPAVTVHRNCASGMESVTTAFERLRAGRGKLMLVGGTENMSRIPLFYPRSFTEKLAALQKARTLGARLGVLSAFRPRDFSPQIGLLLGLTDPVCGMGMGQTAEVLAKKFVLSRREQDEYALRSHQKAVQARERLAEEILPVITPDLSVTQDIGPRENQTLQALEKLRPIFDRKFGTVTAGNACPVTDGAAALLVSLEKDAKSFGVPPLGFLRAYAYSGCPPEQMGLGPVFSTARLLKETQVPMKDIELFEINEAFSCQVLACLRLFASPTLRKEYRMAGADLLREIDPLTLNLNGGAVALGHPVGSSGTRLILTLLMQMRRSQANMGLATLCVGGGQGAAMLLERT